MPKRTSKEYDAFTNMIDRLLTVPKDEILRRQVEHRERSNANPRKRGPKPKVTPSATDHGEGTDGG